MGSEMCIRDRFKEALLYFPLDKAGFTLHSLRHGGATRDYLGGVALNDIMVKGRWVSLSSCRRYLNAGQGLLLRVRIPRSSRLALTSCAEITRNLQIWKGWTA